MLTLKSFCEQISTKTLIVFCNDCMRTKEAVENSSLVVTTAFANLVSPETGFDKEWVEYMIKTESIQQIMIAGHCDCHIIQFLYEDHSDNPHWKEAKTLLNQLQVWLGRYSKMTDEDRIKFMIHYTSLQVQDLHCYLEKFGLDIKVKGIVIDENQRNCIKEVESNHFPGFNHFLN